MTLEKVVPTLKDALFLLRTLCRSATGQQVSAYVSMDTGPKKQDEIDGPEELHIVILDNGRTKVYADPEYRQALQCIRCGACSNFCPVYRKIGGYSYGWVYSGPMGNVLSPMLLGLDRTRHLYHACSLCQQCKVICPGGVDHPKLMLRHRSRNREKNDEYKGTGERLALEARYRAFAEAASHPGIWHTGVVLARSVLNRNAKHGFIQNFFGKTKGWFSQRNLPAMGKPTFRQWFRQNENTLKEKDNAKKKQGNNIK